jgi:hypothetical protein
MYSVLALVGSTRTRVVTNNWDLADQDFKKIPDPALSTRFGGNGFVVFFGLAKPVRTPLVGPPRAPQS